MSHLEQRSIAVHGVSIRAFVVGVWALKAYINTRDGAPAVQPFGASPTGILIYTSDFFVSAQLMDPGRQPSHGAAWGNLSPQEYEAFGRGYIGYCGRYEVDEELATVAHIPTVAFLPSLVGQRLLRRVRRRHDRVAPR